MHDRSLVTANEMEESARALNPFSSDIRHFKTVFDIADAEGMMDFGIWLLGRFETECTRVLPFLELYYELMRRSVRDGERLAVVIEESFEELYVTMKLSQPFMLSAAARKLAEELQPHCRIEGGVAAVRLGLGTARTPPVAVTPPVTAPSVTPKVPEPEPILAEEPAVVKEVRIVETQEKQLLRQSFTQKTSAIDYVRDIGGDVLDEVRDLESLDAEWMEKLQILESEPGAENIRSFVDGVLGTYVRVINNLFEFTALAYALASLGGFLKENAALIVDDPKKTKTLIMLLEHLGSDLSSWREHIFSLQDTADIHYLDSSFFSSCMQIEGIIAQKEVATDDDNDFEFF